MADEQDKSSDDEGIPLSRVVTSIVVFGIWSVAVSTVHAFFPERFDLISAVIAEIGIVPVAIFLFRSLDFGFGDWKVSLKPGRIARAFKNLGSLENRVSLMAKEPDASRTHGVQSAVYTTSPAQVTSGIGASKPLDVASDDVVLIRLRREIQSRLKKLASQCGIPGLERRSASGLLRLLSEYEVIRPKESRGLFELIQAGNAQAHGATVNPDVAELARTEGDRLLATLDLLILRSHDRIIVLEIAELAAKNGKTAIVDQPLKLNGVTYRPDILIPHEVVIEVRIASGITDVQNALAQLRRYMEVISDVKGLLVLGDKPHASIKDLKRTFPNIGVAWDKNQVFDGDSEAKEFAPWLFNTSAKS